MDWLVLALLVPAIVVPVVVWFGFSGCNQFWGLEETHPEPPPPLPVAPVNFKATLKAREGSGALDVDLSWENNDMDPGVEFRVERLVDGEDDFVVVHTSTAENHTDLDVPQDTFFFYRVRAANANGVGEPCPFLLIKTIFVAAFDSQNALVISQANASATCLVQRIDASHFQTNLMMAKGVIARVKLKGPTNAPVVVNRVYLSQEAVANDPRNPGNPTPDPWDSLPTTDPGGIKIEGGLTKVFDRDAGDAPVTMVAPTAGDPDSNRATLNLVNYTLDPAQDLIVAIDVGGPGSPANLSRGVQAGVTDHNLLLGATPLSSMANRPAGFSTNANTLFLIEKIEVIKEDP